MHESEETVRSRPNYGTDVYSVPLAAWITRLSSAVIVRACNSGELPCFIVPGGRARRILRRDLVAFMATNGIPTDRLEEDDALMAATTGGDRNVANETSESTSPRRRRPPCPTD